MKLPVVQENGAEQSLGTGSLELVRANMRKLINARKDLEPQDREYILEELDSVIEGERIRRARALRLQLEREELDHRIEAVQKVANLACAVRTQIARADAEIARNAQETVNGKLDIAERMMKLREKYKPVPKKDEHQEEIDHVRKRQSITDMREDATVNAITKRAFKRAAFVKRVKAEFPDMADDLIDYYDQQIFQRDTRR